jgi:hypothetical protein
LRRNPGFRLPPALSAAAPAELVAASLAPPAVVRALASESRELRRGLLALENLYPGNRVRGAAPGFGDIRR